MKQTILLLLVIILSACKNDHSKEVKIDSSNDTVFETSRKSNVSQNKIEKKPFKWEGTYQLQANEAQEVSCPCNCVVIDFNEPQTLCIDKKSSLTIHVNYKKSSEDKVEMYYVNGKGETEIQKDIPWDKFDKDTPLAILTVEGKSVKLDWKSFTINQKIAVDYAIFGKKNLEGIYHKK